jgi:hypothetical protein
MYNRSFIFINDIISDFKVGSVTEMYIDKFIDNFLIANKEFSQLTEQLVIENLKRNFLITKTSKIKSELHINKYNLQINLNSFFSFFVKKLKLKIKISEFLEITLNTLIFIYENLEKQIIKIYDYADTKRQGYITLREFEEMISRSFSGVTNKWQLLEYFKQASGSQDNIFLPKDEFIIFCLNTKDILVILLSNMKKI